MNKKGMGSLQENPSGEKTRATIHHQHPWITSQAIKQEQIDNLEQPHNTTRQNQAAKTPCAETPETPAGL
jgi:hypothetical protein